MKFNNLQKECYDRAAYLCSRSEKSSGSICKKLQDWGLAPDEAEQVLKKLTADQFIDDIRFAKSYVRDKFRFNKWGKIKIQYQLKAENISGNIIKLAIEEIDNESYIEILSNLISDKNKTIQSVNPYERRGKLLRFAQSRGFEPELIHTVIDQVEKGIDFLSHES
ncbi:MAG: regulatory protein RecX [Prolixibacteraceae bacterium]